MRKLYAAGLLIVAAGAAGAAWWLHVPSRYFPAAELDHVAAPLRRIDFEYPEKGPEVYGTLRLDVLIDEKGVVDRVDVVESTVPPSFRNYAISMFTATRFEPAQRKGRAVKSVKRVEVVFAPPPATGLKPAH